MKKRPQVMKISLGENMGFSQIDTKYDGDPIPTVSEYSRLGGSADSADFQGPIGKPVSDDFRHFFTQIATEYDGDPIPTVTDYSRLGGTADSAVFHGQSPDPFLTIFAIFFTQSDTEGADDSPYARSTRSGQMIHLMRVQRAFITCLIIKFYQLKPLPYVATCVLTALHFQILRKPSKTMLQLWLASSRPAMTTEN
ncbi:MAG: hypothetical protein GY696_07115 [Gammaproteobacteria bacterium]|nr:hypothetical protein [Gammaproteobacteria bacterium]